MSVLVDTSIWSLAFRRRRSDLSSKQTVLVRELEKLVRDGNARIMGPIRQEILSGIRHAPAFEGIRADLREFSDEPLAVEDFEFAAEISNRCRAAGISGSPVDFLICSTAARRQWAVFTSDADFLRYAGHAQFRLHAVSL